MLLLMLSCLVLVLPGDCTCPDSSWTAGAEEDTCYLVSDSGLSFDGGLEWCGQRGGYLAEINSPAEQQFLETFLRSDLTPHPPDLDLICLMFQ